MSREKALLTAEKAREKLMQQKAMAELDSLNPLLLETKSGPFVNPEKAMASVGSGLTILISQGTHPRSPGLFSSPRRRFSSSPSRTPGVVASQEHIYKSNFNLKLTEVSRELETYISRQVLSSVLKEAGSEASPR